MMQGETGEITLAGEKVSIQALTLDQLQVVLPALEQMNVARDAGERIKQARAVIVAATGKSDEEIGRMPITLPELLDSVKAIVKLTGLEEMAKNAKAAATG